MLIIKRLAIAVAISFALPNTAANADTRNFPTGIDRHLQEGGRRPLTKPCDLVVVEVDFEDGHRQERVECILHNEDVPNGSASTVHLHGLPFNFVVDNNVYEGDKTLFVEGSEIDENTNELVFPADSMLQIAKSEMAAVEGRMLRRRLQSESKYTGTKTALVVRFETTDSSTSATEDELRVAVFDQLGSIGTQYQKCSYEQLKIKKAPTSGNIHNGVLTVKVNAATKGMSSLQFNEIALEAIRDMPDSTGSKPPAIDLVLFCFPPGTTFNGQASWTAYAGTNDWASTYNDGVCLRPGTVMHEVGHNLGLAHSGEYKEGTQQLIVSADRTGYMGAGVPPTACFNGAKTYQLGWFADQHVEVSPSPPNRKWRGTLVGFTERDMSSSTDKMVVRIDTGVDKYYYVHYNRANDFNNGTAEGRDLVHVSYAGDGTKASQSVLVATMGQGTKYSIHNFGNTGKELIVHVRKIEVGNPHRAHVAITMKPKSIWWPYIVATHNAETTLRNCGGTRVPSDGSRCNRAENTLCYFGEQSCTPIKEYPTLGCACEGLRGNKTWVCSSVPCPFGSSGCPN